MPTVASGFFEGTTAAAGDLRLGVKFDEFSNMVRELQASLRGGASLQRVIEFEVSRILQAAITRTGKADQKKIEVRVKNRATFVINGKRWATRDWKTGQSWHVPNDVWAEIEAKRARSLTRKLNKIGLSKKSWWLVAQKLHMDIEAPAYVKNAHATTFDSSQNVDATKEATNGNFGIAIENRMPILRFVPPGGTQALFSAVTGRTRFFENNVAHGVFTDMDAIMKKYPGIATNAAAMHKDDEIPEFD